MSDFEDLVGYHVYYLEKDGGNLGDWTLLGFYTDESMNFTGQGGLTYRFKSIAIDTNGNIENKGTYDTEMRIDLDLPMSTLWLIEGDLQFTNLEGVTLQWKANDTLDIQAYLIEYRIVGNNTWNDFGAFTSPGEFWFSPEGDAKFEIYRAKLAASTDAYPNKIDIVMKNDCSIYSINNIFFIIGHKCTIYVIIRLRIFLTSYYSKFVILIKKFI